MDEKIEEMAKIMYGVEAFELETLAEALYNAGYRKIPELPQETVLTVDDIAELLTIVARETRKKTARKFAKRLKEKLNEWLEDNEDLNGKIDFGIAMIELIGVKSLDGEVIAESLIDEIFEEITEGKDV